MSEITEEMKQAIVAVKVIFGDLDPRKEDDFPKIMTALESVVSIILIAGMGTPKLAASMLNEGLLPGVEARLAMYRKGGK